MPVSRERHCHGIGVFPPQFANALHDVLTQETQKTVAERAVEE